MKLEPVHVRKGSETRLVERWDLERHLADGFEEYAPRVAEPEAAAPAPRPKPALVAMTTKEGDDAMVEGPRVREYEEKGWKRAPVVAEEEAVGAASPGRPHGLVGMLTDQGEEALVESDKVEVYKRRGWKLAQEGGPDGGDGNELGGTQHQEHGAGEDESGPGVASDGLEQ